MLFYVYLKPFLVKLESPYIAYSIYKLVHYYCVSTSSTCSANL